MSPGAAQGADVERLLARAGRLLTDGESRSAPLLADAAALRREAKRLRPRLEELVGRRYGRLPRIGIRRGLEACFAGPWSQYLTLGLGPTRCVRITSREAARPVLPTILAHELAHRFAFDESVTTLRAIELSARLGEEGDAMHARAVRLQLGQLALGAALAAASRSGEVEALERFLAGRARGRPAEPVRDVLATVRRAAAAGRGPGCVGVLYAEMPAAALDAAHASGARSAGPLPHPRFPIRSLASLFFAATAAADALSGRRQATLPVEAALRLWQAAET